MATRPVFGIFEGGGARGIAHLGALEATEKKQLEFVGVAGASAGALVATLIAAGFGSAAILNIDNPKANILSTAEQTVQGVLDEKRWRQFVRFRRGLRRFALGSFFGGIATGIMLAPRTAFMLFDIRRERGHFSTTTLRRTVNKILRERLIDVYVSHGLDSSTIPERIRFRDLDFEKFPELRPLKIVATDLSRRALTIFDFHRTPEVEIAEAVVASIAIPLVFQPVAITSHNSGRNGLYVDGGLISNLPSWLFQEEKLAFERTNPALAPVPVIGFTLVDKPTRFQGDSEAERLDNKAVNSGSIFSYVNGIVRTAIFGSQEITHRFVEDLLVVPLRTDLELLDFDAPWAKLREAYIAGRRCAEQQLTHSLTVRPERVNAELRRIADLAFKRINEIRESNGQSPLAQLRANIIERFGASSFRVTYAYNMAGDADDRLLLDARAAGAPEAFERKTLTIVKVDIARKTGARDFMTKYERALVRPQLSCAICVPIFPAVSVWELPDADRPTPCGVFSIDSDDELETDYEDDRLKRLLAEESTVLSSIFEGNVSHDL